MANRHKARGSGFKKAMNAGGNPAVIKEARQLKRGGVAKHASGGKIEGKATGGRLDRRARGGGVGADKSPYSSAKFKQGGSVKG